MIVEALTTLGDATSGPHNLLDGSFVELVHGVEVEVLMISGSNPG